MWIAWQLILLTLFALKGVTHPYDSPPPTTAKSGKATPQFIAYVSEDQLWLTIYDGSDTPPRGQVIDRCQPEPAYCWFANLRWSPTGEYLLYLKVQGDQARYHLLDRQGQRRALPGNADNGRGLSAPVWSATGQSLLYTEVAGLRRIDAPFTDDGRIIGVLTNFGDSSCGGGGYPASELVYWQEGLGTFPHMSLPGHLAWLANDRLLYSRHCTGAGMGQFDLQTGAELPMLDEDRLLLFTTNQASDHWAAITWDHHLAIGSADAGLIGTRPVAEKLPSLDEPGSMNQPGATLAGGVFYGPVSDRLHYTTRQLQQWVHLTEEQFFGLDPAVQERFVSTPHFPIYQTTLFATTTADWQQAQIVWQGDAYGIGNVTEAANGDLLFVRVDNGQALYETLQADPTLAEMQDTWPKPQIIRLPADGDAPQILLDNAGQLALAPLFNEP
jgi:hypothetical protein